MSGDDARVGIERVQALLDRSLDGREVAARQIGAPDRALEQGVAGQQQGTVVGVEAKAAAPRRVPRRVDDLRRALAEAQLLAVREPMLDGQDRTHAPAE